jgi:hypothetical protein
MQTRRGRRPLAAGHVEHLNGSELAKLRLSLILRTMLGELSVAEACAELEVCESRFHALRTHWLQESLELLEPRRTGRPPKLQEGGKPNAYSSTGVTRTIANGASESGSLCARYSCK